MVDREKDAQEQLQKRSGAEAMHFAKRKEGGKKARPLEWRQGSSVPHIILIQSSACLFDMSTVLWHSMATALSIIVLEYSNIVLVLVLC